jgi:DNA-binding transcriptional LysR family regulator
LRIKMHPVFAHLLAGPRFKGFLESHPQLNIELITQDRLGDLVGEGFDLAIHLGEPPASSLVARKLWDTSIITAAAPEYLKRYGRPASPQDMRGSGHVLIDFRNPETSRPFEWEFHRGRKIVQVPTRGHLTVSDIVTLHNLCLSGYGIAQVMEFAVSGLIAEGSLIDLFPDWPDERFPMYALYPSRNYLPAKTRTFLEFVTSLVSPKINRSGQYAPASKKI